MATKKKVTKKSKKTTKKSTIRKRTTTKKATPITPNAGTLTTAPTANEGAEYIDEHGHEFLG